MDFLYSFLSSIGIRLFRKALEKLSDYDNTNQKYFEKQVKIDIGKELNDMKKFMEEITKLFL